MSGAALNAAEAKAALEARRSAHCRELALEIQAAWNDEVSGPETCLDRLRQRVLSDRVAFYFNVSVRQEDRQLVLTGEVERPEFRALTRGVFEVLSAKPVVDRIELAPDLGRDPAPFGIALAPHVLTWSDPRLEGTPMDEALLGEPLYLLKELPEAWLIKTFTGYWGYARKSEVRRIGREAFVRLLNEPVAELARDWETGPLRLPAGCRLPVVEWTEAERCRVLGPAGNAIDLPRSVCRRHDRRAEMARVVEHARTFLGSPYQMGGKNRVTGIDCSGLIQLSYRTVGVSLPRDAKQQYLGGYLIMPWLKEALLPGDVVYFMNAAGQVDHTGLYLGQDEIIHATMPRVCIQSLNPAATNYCKRFDNDFLGAKRFCW